MHPFLGAEILLIYVISPLPPPTPKQNSEMSLGMVLAWQETIPAGYAPHHITRLSRDFFFMEREINLGGGKLYVPNKFLTRFNRTPAVCVYTHMHNQINGQTDVEHTGHLGLGMDWD